MFTSTTLFSALTANLFASRAYTAPTSSLSAAPGTYSLVADHSGNTFFDGFDAFTAADPTNGNVNYVGKQYAAQHGLMGYVNNHSTNSTNAYIGVDYTNVTAARNSVRLSSHQTFDAGMIMTLDVVHAPVAYGAWPALWLLGDVPGSVWPAAGGEADILEWVHESSYNSMTLHTASGCTVDNSSTAFQGQLQSANCNAGSGSDGCSIETLDQVKGKTGTLTTAGPAFNSQGGAVFVVNWQTTGLSIYIFGRDNVPADITACNPNPASWNAVPAAQFSGSGCDFNSSLSTMQIITDTTFCGDWAGKVWESSGAVAATGAKTCTEYVTKNATAFKDAYFEIASIKVYSNNGQKPGIATNAKRDASAAPITFPMINIADRHDCGNTTETPATTIAAPNNSTNGTGHYGHHHHHAHFNSSHVHGNHSGHHNGLETSHGYHGDHGHLNGTHTHGKYSSSHDGSETQPVQPRGTMALSQKDDYTNGQSYGFQEPVGSAAPATFQISSADVYGFAAVILIVIAFAL